MQMQIQRCLSLPTSFDASVSIQTQGMQDAAFEGMRREPSSAVIRELVDTGITRENNNLRNAWTGAVCRELGVPDSYQRAAALFIHWDTPFDKDGKCADETKKLERIFREKYGFETKTVQLKCYPKDPQLQLNCDITKFIYDHDGDHRSTLLVVYYSGHGDMKGRDGSDEFYITGKGDSRKSSYSLEGTHNPKASWNNVDHHLSQAKADVLTIMDCCYATDVGRSGGDETRTFETLAASDKMTPSPGEKSFTNALITVLEQSLSHKSEELRVVDTDYLIDQIRTRQKSQRPRIINRMKTTVGRHIQLKPLSKPSEPKPEDDPYARPRASSLRLQIDFAERTSLTEDQARLLGKNLASAANKSKLGITGLDWVEFIPRNKYLPNMVEITHTTWLVHAAIQRRARKLSKRLQDQSNDNEQPRKRQRPDSTPVVKRSPTPPSSSGVTPATS